MRNPHRTAAVIGAAVLLAAASVLPAYAAGGSLTIAFDDGINDDSLGSTLAPQVDLRVVTAYGGVVSQTSSWDGTRSAARTPSFDGSTDGPRGVVGVTNRAGDVLSPGAGELTFGADIKLDTVSSQAGSTDNGDNVLQRGLFGGNQYKIQADHDVASCRLSGSAGALSVFSSGVVTPGQWFRLRCHRVGNQVTLTVAQLDASGTPRTVSTNTKNGAIGSVTMATGVPLSVGGKLNNNGTLTAAASDQFNGAIANVLVRFG